MVCQFIKQIKTH